MQTENVIEVNKDISVVAYYFKNAGRRLRCFPKKIEYEGKTIAFNEIGLRHPAKRGKRMVHIFDMTDGNADYRLEFDAEQLNWKLLSISDAPVARPGRLQLQLS